MSDEAFHSTFRQSCLSAMPKVDGRRSAACVEGEGEEPAQKITIKRQKEKMKMKNKQQTTNK